ncbi:MAG: NCS2 family permease, partial [Exiguobacterium acetylicum]
MSTQLKQPHQPKAKENAIARFFDFNGLGTNMRTEFIAGMTTFFAMAYILFVNPNTLAEAGMDAGAVFGATALVAIIGSVTMGLLANYPIALAPGMGLNAFFAYSVVIGMGIPWQTALSGVLVSGLVFMVLTASGIREMIINAIPEPLKMAVAAGIGLFIAFIGLKTGGLVVANEATLVSLGDLSKGTTLLAVFGLVVSAVLMTRGVKGAIFFGMILTAVAGMIFGLIPVPTSLGEVISAPPSIAPTFGQAFLHFDEIFTVQMMIVILTFFFVDFFDTAGTLVAVANQAGLIKENKVP